MPAVQPNQQNEQGIERVARKSWATTLANKRPPRSLGTWTLCLHAGAGIKW